MKQFAEISLCASEVHLGPLSCVCRAVSDVAGGYSASMLDAVRRTLDLSKILNIQDSKYDTLTFEEVFRLATLGGSQGRRLLTHNKD